MVKQAGMMVNYKLVMAVTAIYLSKVSCVSVCCAIVDRFLAGRTLGF
jgi:hypothetical protein